jgi:DnaJ family protein C protein 9
MFDDASAMGSWEAYFAAVYQKVDKKMLDEDRERYQGAPREISSPFSATDLLV